MNFNIVFPSFPWYSKWFFNMKFTEQGLDEFIVAQKMLHAQPISITI
jgi:hypothetical protein